MSQQVNFVDLTTIEYCIMKNLTAEGKRDWTTEVTRLEVLAASLDMKISGSTLLGVCSKIQQMHLAKHEQPPFY